MCVCVESDVIGPQDYDPGFPLLLFSSPVSSSTEEPHDFVPINVLFSLLKLKQTCSYSVDQLGEWFLKTVCFLLMACTLF